MVRVYAFDSRGNYEEYTKCVALAVIATYRTYVPMEPVILNVIITLL